MKTMTKVLILVLLISSTMCWDLAKAFTKDDT